MIDIFNDDAFGVVSLTDTINDAQFVPGYTRQLGLFQETGTSKLTVAIEKKGDVLVLIPPTPRGAPGTTLDKAKRNIRSLDIPHFEVNDAIYADEVQGVRKLGSEDEVETVLDKIAESPGYTQNPTITKALVYNPKTPVKTAIRLLDRLPRSEVMNLAKRTTMNQRLVMAAKKKLERKTR